MSNDTTNTWPARLKAWREGQRISMEGAARKVGGALATWQRWEAGDNRPGGLATAALEILLRDTGQR